MTETPSKTQIADQIQSLAVLVVDDNQYMRKMIRNLLVNSGIKDIYEANDGIAALDAIRSIARRITVFNQGEILMEGGVDQVFSSQAVRDVYLGKKAAA